MTHLIKFISDLHLETSRPDISEAFAQFIRSEASQCQQLYILGDLFESWIGDDDNDPFITEIANLLATLTAAGCQVFFMPGNRDFLLGESYAERCAMTILPDPYVINPFGQPILLMHGDTLCTRDIQYQQFRSYIRQPAVQAEFLAKPLEQRRAFVQAARQQSQEYTQQSSADIMDVTPEEVPLTMQQHGVLNLIHGHTHRPAVHTLTVNEQTAQRIVLGDWYAQSSVLTLSSNGFDTQQLVNHA